MKRIIRALPVLVIIILVASQFLSGCKAPCDYPNARGVVMRIINAMPDMPVITVLVNGKAVVKNYAYDPSSDSCLYKSNYLDGTPLPSGDSVLFQVSSDAGGSNILVSKKLPLNFQRQTIIVMGRGIIKSPQRITARIIRMEEQTSDITKSLIRFVNAIPDLDSLDVFFKGDTAGKPLGVPDLTLHYGEATPHLPLGNITGLTVTEAGHPDNIIFSVPYALGGVPGFFATVLVRGETKPICTDFTAAPILYSDEECGNYLIIFKTFAVRQINATRSSNLSLWIRSTTLAEKDKYPRGSELGVADYPNQQKVKGIPAGTVSDYIPLNIALNSSTEFFFAKDNKMTSDTIGWIDLANANIRYSKIAVEENPFGTSGKKISHLNLPDTMCNVAGNFGRVRVINLSPDHTSVSVTLAGRTVSMVQKQVEFFDVPLTNSNIVLTDGSTTKTYSIPASGIEPISVYILPEQSATPALPILTSQD